jgi:hypothetical protein
MDLLAEFTGHCLVCWGFRGIAGLRGVPLDPQMGTFGVDLLGHKRNLNKAR